MSLRSERWQKLGVHDVSKEREHAVHGVHGECSQFLGACSRVFTALVSARSESVHTGGGVCKTPTVNTPSNNLQALLLASFPGSEVVFEYVNSEPELEAQAEEMRRWNEWVSVLNDDRTSRA